MTRSPRCIAIAATLAVLATALWPLVTSLAAAGSGEAVPLCQIAVFKPDGTFYKGSR